MKGEPKLVLAFLATLLLLAANGYVSWRAVRVVTSNDRLLVHTQEVLTALEALQSTVTDAETGQRGFLLTGKEPYLLPYQEARASLSARLARLRSLTADNPVQQGRLPLLESTIRAKMAELGETVELRRKGGLAAALQVVESDRGASLMNGIREIVASMKAEENRLLTLRVRESERSANTVQATLWVANLIAIGLLAAFMLLAFRRVAEQQRNAREQERLTEGERRACIQAEEANRSKDEFLATVSHELRNPLNAIAGWTVILRGGPADPQACHHAADVIERNARALTRIVEDILDVSRIVTGKLHIEPRETELTPVVRAAVDAVRPAAEAKRIRIETDLEPAGPVWGDPDRLQQVIWNLVSNAVKFTPKEGRVEVRLHRAGSQVEITVSDNGPGIPEDLLPHVFDRFRQADSSSTRRHGGLGLGLAVVRHLVELHGGTVAVASGSDSLGTTFTVSLPVRTLGTVPGQPAAEESPKIPVAAAPESPLRGLRTLVVEDDPDSLEMVCTLLAQRGAEVRPAASTAEALAVIESWRPDLLISDLGMPEEDGYTLIRRVRALPAERGGQVPAVALSARTRPEDRIEALSAGFQMHVAKPVAPAELLAVALTLAGPGRPS
jgi:signal transduction histidine kinase/ActR/RegA family two-component response regulator